MSEWQSIETAPKDGTLVLLWVKNDFPFGYARPDLAKMYTLGFFGDANYNLTIGHGSPSVDADTGMWFSIEMVDNGYSGSEYTGWCSDWECVEVEPTHWMPLPAPPQNPDSRNFRVNQEKEASDENR